jgi:DNA-binding LacI/PurR family transcriptional regulator
MATIRDVARKAGVSVSTVSRVLNNSGYYDEQTGRDVARAVEELGYRQNIHWTRLKRNSSDTMAFVLGNRDAMNSMHVSLLMACQEVLHEAGYDLVFTTFRYSQEEKSSRLALPRILGREGMVDGVILAGVHHDNLLERFSELGMPYVLLGNTFIGSSEQLQRAAVTYDDIAGAYEAAQYLIRLGHRRIAFCGNLQLPWFERRHQGYMRAMKEAGLSPKTAVDDWQVTNVEYGQLAAAQLQREPAAPTAIFAGNDEIAAGIWKELIKRRVEIPREVSLVGFGDRHEFFVLEPSLTTVSVYQEKLGRELARMLLARLGGSGNDIASKQLPCKVIERNSCAPPLSRVQRVRR